jgi:HK97 gp10 family phage protein
MSLRGQVLQALVNNIAQEVVDAVNDVLANEANKMLRDMRAAAPKKTGTLASTIHAERFGGKNSIGVRISAGGPATTKPVRQGAGKAFDYSRAVEFGTHHAGPHPFFFTTYRRDKDAAKQAIRASVKQAMQKAVQEARR